MSYSITTKHVNNKVERKEENAILIDFKITLDFVVKYRCKASKLQSSVLGIHFFNNSLGSLILTFISTGNAPIPQIFYGVVSLNFCGSNCGRMMKFQGHINMQVTR